MSGGLVCFISDKACWSSANPGWTSGKCGCAAPPDKAFLGSDYRSFANSGIDQRVQNAVINSAYDPG